MCRRVKPADFLTESNEDFFGRVIFVGECDEHAFFISRRHRGQREHVAADDILLDLRDLEITLGILTGDMRMMEAMELFELDLVPVVKKIVVKKSASHKLLLLKAEGEDHGPEQSGLGHSDAVIVAGALAVLLEFLKLIEKTGV